MHCICLLLNSCSKDARGSGQDTAIIVGLVLLALKLRSRVAKEILWNLCVLTDLQTSTTSNTRRTNNSAF